jgi:hypothetical protein
MRLSFNPKAIHILHLFSFNTPNYFIHFYN